MIDLKDLPELMRNRYEDYSTINSMTIEQLREKVAELMKEHNVNQLYTDLEVCRRRHSDSDWYKALIEATTNIEEHPHWYENECYCDSCLQCG